VLTGKSLGKEQIDNGEAGVSGGVEAVVGDDDSFGLFQQGDFFAGIGFERE
jgi:hypothetical protein